MAKKDEKSLLNITISDEAFNRYQKDEQTVINRRLRGKNEDFLDALLSVNMTATSGRRETLNAISKLN